ncbi:MAG: methionyl-tRNA formyltransferase [Chloroflexota bacterium]
MRLLFMGTPRFAVPPLEALVKSGFDVAAVVTQPDRPVGRGLEIRPSAVKALALREGIAVLQPPSLRAPDAVNLLRAVHPDLIVVVAFGQILRRAVLDIPRLGCVNVHPSLLPKLRGASPIQAAIREGLPETGVSIMLMDERMDAGPILAQVTAVISDDDTTASLGERLSRLGADLLVDTIPAWEAGRVAPRAQDENAATYCRPLVAADATVDWSLPAAEIARICRAQTPWPGCRTFWGTRQVRLLALGARPDWTGPEAPGTVLALPSPTGRQPEVAIATGGGAIVVRQLQLAGKRPLPSDEFVRGQPHFVGARLTEASGGSPAS